MGKIRRDLAVRLQAILFDNSHDAHNRHRLLRIEPQVFSDGVAVWPKALCEFFVNDYHLRFVRRIILCEKSALRSGISIVRK